MPNATLVEQAQILGFLAIFMACLQWGLSLALLKFVALSQPPAKRAMWTALSSYLVVALGFAFSGPQDTAIAAPLAGLPGALICFLYWRRAFVRAWYDDPAMIPEGMTAANEDWRLGLWLLVSAAAILIIKKAPVVFAVQQATGK